MKNLTIRQDLLRMYAACESLKTNDILRNSEIKNIQMIIKCLIHESSNPRGCSAQIALDKYQLEGRINELADNVEYAGKHEIHRNSFNKQNAN